ncbi:hypothetical protein [Nocardia sp. BMG111209]|uniref:hypothetical protein n=1 Tax=Nocardia sp. BMG111209 TaxID=1160137 RepID=UPI001E4033A7|nr:hypothetical protein [Nocardia sp. BMG111209]
MSGQVADSAGEQSDNSLTGSTEEADVAFALAHHDPPVPTDPRQLALRTRELTHTIARELAAAAPAGWERLDAVFVWTVAAQSWRIAVTEGDRPARMEPSIRVLAAVREQREAAARMAAGPWWRMLIRLTAAGGLDTDYDYGDEPFPDEDLLAPDAYLADLQAYPRARLPVWLAAYVGHRDRQLRSPRAAAEQARRHRDTGTHPLPSTGDFPDLPRLWARWATLAAVYAAVGSSGGPRILPSLAWFEGMGRSGSSLYLLAHDRAVISGGVWNASNLDAAYNGKDSLPDLYAGAPEWITDAVLNPRAAAGTLSFCYWWDDGRWYRGESPAGPDLAPAVPGLWTAESTAGVAGRVLAAVGRRIDADVETAAAQLISAAESGTVTRSLLAGLLDSDTSDIDAAHNQLTLAGLTSAIAESPLPQQEAVARVRAHILEQGHETTAYPLDRLKAERVQHGWMVYVPTAPGQVMLGRAVYYIADDAVVEKSSSSVPPQRYLIGFGHRYRDRARAARSS